MVQTYGNRNWLRQKPPVTLQGQIVLEARLQSIKKVAGGAGAGEIGRLGEHWQETEGQRWHLEGHRLSKDLLF